MRLLMLLAVILGLIAPRESRAQDKAQTDLRVMSFNIRYGTAKDGDNHWNSRKDFLIDTIRAFDPDLLGTQETLEFQSDWLATHLDGYTAIGVGRDDGGSAGEMTALLYRSARFHLMESGHFWLSETPDVPGSKNWDAALTRMVTWVKLRDRRTPELPPLYFFNTHFDHIGKDARARSAGLLHDRVAALPGGARVIVTGDFNEGEASPPYQALFAPAGDGSPLLRDTYRIVHPRREAAEATINGFDAKVRDGDRIDWIACTKSFRVESAQIDRTTRDGRVPSDHFAVTAVLSVEQ